MSAVFDSVLVANRGEIACRVIRTLRRLGIRSVAVYSDADTGAPHTRLAELAVRIGPAPATDSYLDAEAILLAARRTGAQAVHPGYGFLSENAGFARACAAAGLVFIGPSPDALRIMADKIAAKERVLARGVPVVPGSSGAGLDDAALVAAAGDVGFPLLIKPSAGGGGKGMQVVRERDALPAALASARRVAAAAFGDDTLLLERLVERPRHIEVQVLADRAGSTVHLGERECSLQRRHQKVIEEAPSPVIDAATRERIGAAACEVARSVGYEGAGTVEFLVSGAERIGPGSEFFFIEMNTRLQVEHPVTELVTGVDLVEQQLRIAAGQPLGFGQESIRLTGHAIEARVYAESPARGSLPATGTVLALREAVGDGRRWDGGVAAGSVIGGHYDPMLAKAIAHGADRVEALARLDALLAETVLLGVETNLDELRAILAEPEVRDGRLDVGLLDRRPVPAAPQPDAGDLVLAALVVLAARMPEPGTGAWRPDGWRPGGRRRPVTVRLGSAEVEVTGVDGGAVARIDDVEHTATLASAAAPGAWRFTLDGVAEDVDAILDAAVAPPSMGPASVWLHRRGRTLELPAPTRAEHTLARLAAIERAGATGPAAPELRTPMPGTVVAVAVPDGGAVAAGDPLVTVEAMKMEHLLAAPVAGTARLRVQVGDAVRRDQIVAEIDRDPVQSPTREDVA